MLIYFQTGFACVINIFTTVPFTQQKWKHLSEEAKPQKHFPLILDEYYIKKWVLQRTVVDSRQSSIAMDYMPAQNSLNNKQGFDESFSRAVCVTPRI